MRGFKKLNYDTRANELFKTKKHLTDTILYLNTAFSLIDKMFQQEITNAELEKHIDIILDCRYIWMLLSLYKKCVFLINILNLMIAVEKQCVK